MEKLRELSAIRADIDAIDDELLELFSRRMRLCNEVARAKAATGGAIERPGREEEILRRIEGAAGQLAPYARRLFQALFSLSREYQSEIMRKVGKAL